MRIRQKRKEAPLWPWGIPIYGLYLKKLLPNPQGPPYSKGLRCHVTSLVRKNKLTSINLDRFYLRALTP